MHASFYSIFIILVLLKKNHIYPLISTLSGDKLNIVEKLGYNFVILMFIE
jgi:hypothetical protein